MIIFFQSINNAAGLTLQVAYPWNLFAYLHLFHHWLAVTKMVMKGVLDNVIFSVIPTFFHVLHGERRLNLFRIYVLSSLFQTGLKESLRTRWTKLLNSKDAVKAGICAAVPKKWTKKWNSTYVRTSAWIPRVTLVIYPFHTALVKRLLGSFHCTNLGFSLFDAEINALFPGVMHKIMV